MAPSRAIRPLYNTCATCAKRPLPPGQFSTTPPLLSTSGPTSHLPRVAQPSFWASLIPKPLRRNPSNPTDPTQPKQPKPWNPATIFIFLGILVGSNSIQILALRNQTLAFSRKTDAKLGLLREVVQKVKRGEASAEDVKRALGTGDPEAEREWEEVMREVESTDVLWEGRQRRAAKKLEKQQQRKAQDEERAKAREEAERKDAEDGKGRRPKFVM